METAHISTYNKVSLLTRIRAALSRVLVGSAPSLYHFWYYHNYVWKRTTWMGVITFKTPTDMWNYQEILYTLKPSLIVEFGTCRGGSALFFASVMRQIGRPFVVLSVDVNPDAVVEQAKLDPDIRLLAMSSTDERVREEIAALRRQYKGAAFFILDSDHSKAHVLAEMISLRDVTIPGDYLVVEDSNVNGHPILRTHGPGPYEAMEEYFRQFPHDYTLDEARERKFGFTFATGGFLIRNASPQR